jgi:hypothetical protein
MNDNTINQLISAREAITNVTADYINDQAVDQIDAVLSEVKPGQRNDVDLLLGRLCAKLPERVDYGQAFYDGLIAARNADAAGPAPKYVSLPKLMGEATPANDWQTFLDKCNTTDQRSINADKGADHE